MLNIFQSKYIDMTFFLGVHSQSMPSQTNTKTTLKGKEGFYIACCSQSSRKKSAGNWLVTLTKSGMFKSRKIRGIAKWQ